MAPIRFFFLTVKTVASTTAQAATRVRIYVCYRDTVAGDENVISTCTCFF